LGQISALGEQAFGGYIVRHLALLQARYPDLTVEIDTSNAVVDARQG